MKKLLLLILISLGVVAGMGYYILFQKSIISTGKEVELKIKESDTWKEVSEKILNQPDINHPNLVLWVSHLLKYDENVHSGRYLLTDQFSIIELVRKLRSGHQDPVNFIIHNITFPEQLAGRVASKLDIDSATFLNYIQNPQTVQRYGFNSENFISMFLCNSYQMYWNVSLETFVERMHQEYKKFWTPDRIAQAQHKGLKPEDVIILASIVQKETNYKPEYGKVASVYLNRLQKGMPLQADPTVKFALKNMAIKRILNKDLTVDSPYNTYKYAGLPPGPIGLPESDVILGVLQAPVNNYLYFCAVYGTGKHVFSSTYTEHLSNARAYQQALNADKIYR